MWSFETFVEEDLINFLERGLLDSELSELINEWEYLSPTVQFHLIKYLRHIQYEPKSLSKELGIKLETATALLQNSSVEFEFPAVIENEGKLVKALAIKDTSENFCNVKSIKRHIKPVEEYLKSKGYVSKGIALIVSAPVMGNSFQLPLALHLCLKELPEDLRWSGGVKKDGRILKVDAIREKAKICETAGKKLANPFHIENLDRLIKYLSNKFVEVPIAVSKDSIAIDSFFREQLSNLESIYHIKKEELLILTGKLENKAWEDVSRSFISKVKELDCRLMGKLKAHIVVNGPASLSFALGILYGHTKPSVIYHYSSSERSYYPVDLENTREIKEHVSQLQMVEKDYRKSGGKDLSVVLFFAHHNPVADVEAFLQREGISSDLLLLTAQEGRGNLRPENFKRIAQECASILQEVKGQAYYENLHFFFSCPVAIAYLFGVAFGHFDRGYIYNYNQNRSYDRVLSLDFLRELIENQRC